MAKVEQKQPIVQEISASIKDAEAVVLVNYGGLTVAEDTQLRNELRKAGVTYKVYKNTLMTLAFKGTACEEMTDSLKGQNAIAVSQDDATAPARIIAKFAKNAKKMEIKAGVIEGKYYDEEGMKAIAQIPSRDELLGRLFGSMQAPIANFARVNKQLADKGGAPKEEPAAEEAPAAEAPAADAAAEEAPKAEAAADAPKAEAAEAPAAEEAPKAE